MQLMPATPRRGGRQNTSTPNKISAAACNTARTSTGSITTFRWSGLMRGEPGSAHRPDTTYPETHNCPKRSRKIRQDSNGLRTSALPTFHRRCSWTKTIPFDQRADRPVRYFNCRFWKHPVLKLRVGSVPGCRLAHTRSRPGGSRGPLKCRYYQ
jgi:hypothetical protein